MGYNNNIKVMIALPCQATVMARTTFSLVHAVRNLPFNVDMMLRMGCDIVGSRTWLVKEAIEREATHILFVDHDMYFPPVEVEKGRVISPIHRLIEDDKDIVGAPYNFRKLPLKSTANPLTEASETELYKVRDMGTGFLMIKLSVFDKWPEDIQWFQFGRDKNGELQYGEDAWFCRNAIQLGFDVWADPLLNVKHIGEYQY